MTSDISPVLHKQSNLLNYLPNLYESKDTGWRKPTPNIHIAISLLQTLRSPTYYLPSFVLACISVMRTCSELEQGSQTLPFEIIPVLGRSRVCGRSPRDRLTPPTEFRWAEHRKKACAFSSIPSVSTKPGSPAKAPFLQQIQYTVKVAREDFSPKQMTSITFGDWKLKGPTLYVSAVRGRGSRFCDFPATRLWTQSI